MIVSLNGRTLLNRLSSRVLMKRSVQIFPPSSRVLIQSVPVPINDFKAVKEAADREKVPVEVMVSRIIRDWCNGDKKQKR